MGWEYHIVELDTRNAEALRAHLNVLGASGWELATSIEGQIEPSTVTGAHALAQGPLILVFKRPIKS